MNDLTPVIGLGLDAITRILDMIFKTRSHLKQSGEWTPQQETEFQNKLATLKAQPHWQITP